MASPVKDAKANHLASGYSEVVERGRGWIRSRKPGTNQFAVTAQAGSRGWHRGNGPYTEADEIDTDWQVDTGTWDYKMIQADYRAYIDAAGNYRYEDYLTDEYVNLDVTFFGWTNDEGQSQAISFSSVTPSVSGDVLTWAELFGTGTTLRIQTQTARLAKFLDIDNLTDLPVPTIGGTNIKLTFSYTLTHSSDVDIYADGELWDENGTVDTINHIEFRQTSSGDPVWWFKVPMAWDTDGNLTVGSQTLKQAGANLFVDGHIPYSWISAASFPITIDPTIDPQVGASADDGRSHTSPSLFIDDGAEIRWGYQTATYDLMNVWARFTGVTIAGTINTSYLTVRNKYALDPDWDVDVSAEDTQSPAAPSSQVNYDAKTRTTNSVNWVESTPGQWAADSAHNSPSLNTVIQELVDSYTYSNGAIQILVDANASTNSNIYYAWDGDSSRAFILHIVYTGSLQYARPDSDISAGNWQPSTGGDLYAMLDEESPAHGDYVFSENDPSVDTFEVGLSALTDPQTSGSHVVRYYMKKIGTNTINLTFYLMEGVTQRDTWSENDVPITIVTGSHTLSAAVADSITDYTDLRIKVSADVP